MFCLLLEIYVLCCFYLLVDEDYGSINITLTFEAGETIKMAPINISDDTVREDYESFTAIITNLNASTSEFIYGISLVPITIIDDDGTTMNFNT